MVESSVANSAPRYCCVSFLAFLRKNPASQISRLISLAYFAACFGASENTSQKNWVFPEPLLGGLVGSLRGFLGGWLSVSSGCLGWLAGGPAGSQERKLFAKRSTLLLGGAEKSRGSFVRTLLLRDTPGEGTATL